jgi:hypothetical protein
MSATKSVLDQIQVASPCQVPWHTMTGDDRVRFCGKCHLHVYDLSAMQRAEAEALVTRTEGNLCVRFYRRADGTVLTRDCRTVLAAARRKLALMLGLAATLLLALLGWAGFSAARSSSADRPAGDQNRPEPLRTILRWLKPEEATEERTMGKLCPPDRPAPGAGKEGQASPAQEQPD